MSTTLGVRNFSGAALRIAALSVLCILAFLSQGRAGEDPNGNRNLVTNPSFEETAGAGADEKLVPGWTLRFRGKETEPALTAEEVAVVDDPAQAHSGKHGLRIRPQKRNIELNAPVAEARAYDPGFYEVSAWVRGRPGTRGFFGTYALGAANNFWGVTESWRKIRFILYAKGGNNNAPLMLGVWKEGEREQIKDPELYVDDLSIVRLISGLADLFGDHMVLQRGKPVPVWGWTKDAGQNVTVSFNGQTKTATADKDGRWEVTFDPMKAGGPFVLELDGRPAAFDVMVGDVWLCSGQSNMEMGVDKVHGIYAQAPEVLAQANHPQIRLWHAAKQFSPEPARSYAIRQNQYLAEHQAVWNVCTPETIARGAWGGFSALGYFFGREIQADQKVAIGLMQVAHGGTAIEAWMSAEALQKIPQDRWVIQPLAQMEHDKAKITPRPKLPDGVTAPTAAYAEAITAANGEQHQAYNYAGACFNSMVAPIFPVALRGVLWNQGEHNGSDRFYAEKLKGLIADWRARSHQEDLPFIITQLCNWQTGPQSHFQWVREAQLQVSREVPNTALAVTIDLADKPGEGGHGTDGYGPGEIHPIRKQEVGHRNALAARALVYGEKIVFSGPVFKACKPENGKLRLTFDSVGGGLIAKGGKLVGFSIAGEDRKFAPAEATIEGDAVVLSAPGVAAPVAARYGFEQFVNPVCNLYNKEELPASPFRTDDWPLE
jgi:sialate O-acetylesterase